MSARIGLGTKAGLVGNDRGSKVQPGKVIFRRIGSILGPKIMTLRILADDIPDVLDPYVAGGMVHGRRNLGLDLDVFGAKAVRASGKSWQNSSLAYFPSFPRP